MSVRDIGHAQVVKSALAGRPSALASFDEICDMYDALKSQRPAQRQDSLDAQLRDLVEVAVQKGMYDAADFIRRSLEK